MNAHEIPTDAARRECLEETGLEIAIKELVNVFGGREHPNGADIFIVYRAEITGGALHAGDDVDMGAFFSRDHLPPLTFSSTRKILGFRGDSPINLRCRFQKNNFAIRFGILIAAECASKSDESSSQNFEIASLPMVGRNDKSYH